MNNNLILRATNSPYSDINKGSVLTHNDVDANFIYLKGESIYSANTTTDFLILNKYNGNDITIPLTNVNITGGTYNINTGNVTFTNSSGGTFSVGGFTSGMTDTDRYVNSGTYSNGTATFNNNSGGTFSVNGFYTGATDTIYTGISTPNKLILKKLNGAEITIPLIIDTLVIFSGTYQTLTTMVDNKSLVVGTKYILTDYKTKYQINSSNSSPINKKYPIIGNASQYSQFDEVDSTIAVNGDTAYVEYAPVGSSVTSGQAISIVEYYNGSYIRFSPQITGPSNIGVIIRFERRRFSNIYSDIIINDDNGKPIMQPLGVINTDVHDGTPYMGMTGIENTAPKNEVIVLTAIDVDKFSSDAESLTYIGDKLAYDFNDNKIVDENGTFITSRNGFVLRRINLRNTININQDWREQKFRRFALNDVLWNNFLLRKNAITNTNSATSGSTIYSIDGINYCTNTSNATLEHRFILSEPIKLNAYQDFAKTTANPFISGTTSAPSLVSSERFNAYDRTDYSTDIILELNISGTQIRDFTILPLVDNEPTDLVTKVIVRDLQNTVFLVNSQRYGDSRNISISSENGNIINSSFMSGANIDNRSYIDNMASLDSVNLTNSNYITNINTLGPLSMDNNGELEQLTFGFGYIGASQNEYTSYNFSDSCHVINSVFGTLRFDNLFFNNFKANSVLFINVNGEVSSFSGNLYLTLYKNKYTIAGCNTHLNTFSSQKLNKGAYGYVYEINQDIYDIDLHNNTKNKNLVYQEIDENNLTSIKTIAIAK